MSRMGLLLFAILITACSGPRYVDFFPCYDDGQSKPRVVLLPIADGTCQDPEFCDDLEQGIKCVAMHRGNLYILDDTEIPCDLRRISEIDYFGNDLSYAKDLHGAQYVVVVEVLHNGLLPGTAVVRQQIRVRALDLRYGAPNIVLQEVFENDYRLPGKSYKQACQKLSNELVASIENVLWSIHK